MINLLVAAALAASPGAAHGPARVLGAETPIPCASGGGLRDWQAGLPRSGILYVRDRLEQWYQISLTGPCTTDAALDTLQYTTDVTGQFDRYSRVTVGRYPGRVCGVTGIRFSAPPPGQPGAAKTPS